MFQPGLHESQSRALDLQARVELLDEGGRHENVGIRELRQNMDEPFRLSFGGREHAIRPGDGRIPLLCGGRRCAPPPGGCSQAAPTAT